MSPPSLLKNEDVAKTQRVTYGRRSSVLKDYWGETLGWTGDFNHARQAAAQAAWALSLALMFPVIKDVLAPCQGGFAYWLSPSLSLILFSKPLNDVWVFKKFITFMCSSKRITHGPPAPLPLHEDPHRDAHMHTHQVCTHEHTGMHMEALKIS